MNNNFKTFFRKDSSRCTNNITSTIQLMLHFNEKAKRNPITGYILVSLGVLLSASSGSWDITNHLLNKPETFFSPPHAGLYIGVVIVLSGSIMVLSRYYSSSNISNNNHYIDKLIDIPLPMKLVTIGVVMLVTAGPFDFAWHSAFGLDGLLSPSHSVLTIGMAVSSIGALSGMLSSNNNQNNNDNNKSRKFNSSITTNSSFSSSFSRGDSTNNDSNNTSHAVSPILIVIGIIPVWITVSGLIHMASLPFSDTEYFNFNPDPTLAAIIATLAFPFIVSFILFSSFQLSVRSRRTKRMFGILSITGIVFIIINLTTAILPNEYLVPTIPFYVLNIIPIVVVDILLSKLSTPKTKIVNYIVGAVIGSIFFTLYYPLITHTYNEVLSNSQTVWPSLTSSIYFKMIDKIYPLVVIPAAVTGILATIISSKIIQDKN
ncbi:MAG TPA: hypothetical protein VKA98_10110 [Nitrososphaeraceae archaeon]|nr:hypothetical protein [Nitrososphaeraceae archaeon]